MFRVAIVCVLLFALPCFAQEPTNDSIRKQIKDLQDTQNVILANQTRAKADIAAISDKLDTLTQKVDAFVKTSVAQVAPTNKMVWQPATSAWGAKSVGKWVNAPLDSTTTPTAETTTMFMPSMSSGSCANGSCGTRIFRMRR